MRAVEKRVLDFEKVTEVLADVVIKEDVVDPVYEVKSGSSKGDGYTSFMTKVAVKGKNKVLPLIIKSIPSSPKIREALPIRAVYLTEILFYKEIIPAFRKFQIEKAVENPFESVPFSYKTIATEMDEMIIMEDLKEKGFKTFERKKQLDDAHVELVLKTYGKFHAVSFAMKEQDYKSFEKLTKNLDPVYSEKHLTTSLLDMFTIGADTIRKSFIANNETYLHDHFIHFKDRATIFLKNISNYKGKYGVIVHGDCWINNMIFKYEEKNPTIPIDLRLFDFQMSSYNSPVIDIAYFFYVSASQEMLDNLDHYLKIYHDSLRSHMLALGSDVEDHYPFSALKEEWTQYAQFGLIVSTVIFKISLQDDDEVLDFCDTASATETFMKESRYDDLIHEKCRKLGLHFYKNKFSF